MIEATPGSVLGDFSGQRLDEEGEVSSFHRRGDELFVTTEGPDGLPTEFRILYTFGVDPLQQYLVELPGGRLQALSLAWDTRPAEQGGQRWFDLYPGVRYDDPLHWTGPSFTWNSVCADCHTTNLRKNFELETMSYGTTFDEIGVACEACHGPGSRHVRWAEEGERGDDPDGSKGLSVSTSTGPWAWSFEGTSGGVARRIAGPGTSAIVDLCAPCHSRRSSIRREIDPAEPFLDSYRPELLRDPLYHADGQILDEVYGYGSFLQSRMHRAGVVCTDCHDPHSARLLVRGNELCSRCHLASQFDSVEHHHHGEGSEAASCVTCHMPSRTYMSVDPRRDHRFGVPRPEVAAELGAPDPCSDCHEERSPAWAAEWIDRWFGPERADSQPFGFALRSGRTGERDAERALVAVVGDVSHPAIVRATAIEELRPWAGAGSIPVLLASLRDENPLVRAAAVRALDRLPHQTLATNVAPLLDDPSRLVRVAAATVLASVSPDALDPRLAPSFERAFEEALEAELANAERPESHVNLALLHLDRNRFDEAERDLRNALRLDPRHVPALVNLADLRRVQGRDEEGREWLGRALEIEPRPAAAVHALGLLEIRSGDRVRGLEQLAEATRLAPEDDQFAYVHAVALHSAGEVGEAVALLETVHRRTPARRDVVQALVSFEQGRGERARALHWARELVEISWGDPRAVAQVKALEE